MTIANQSNRTSATGSGSTGQEIPFLFPISATSDLTVYKLVTATGVQTTLTETTNYTVTISGDTGGTVTTVTTIETTEQIHIVRVTPFTQSLDLVAGGSFNAENIEDALDKNTKLTIQNKDLLDNKAILFPASDPSLTTELPSAVSRASKNLTFDSSGNVTVSDSVETGSVAFSTFGTNMAEAANALAGKAVINLDHVFDVRDYGAVGDGTTDDRAAIQAAIDAASTANGEVFFPMPSTSYFINASLVPKSNVTIRGVEGSTLKFFNIRAFDNSDAVSHFTVRNIIFDGQSGASRGVNLDNASDSHILIENCEFKDLGIAGSFGAAIYIVGASFVRILNNYIHDSRSSITCINVDDLIVKNNFVKDIGPGDGAGEQGLLVTADSDFTGDTDMRRVIIENNIFDTISDHGVFVRDYHYLVPANTSTLKDVIVRGNIVKDTGGSCYELYADDMLVSGNIAIDPFNSGFICRSGVNVTLENNTAKLVTSRTSSISAAILFSFDVSGQSFQNISIKNNKISGDEWRAGIWVFGDPVLGQGQGIEVTGNTVIDAASNTPASAIRGITVNYYNDVQVYGNRLDNTHEGISVGNSTDVTIKINDVVNCTGGSGRGIRTDIVTRAVVSDNFLNNNTKNYDLDAADTRLVEPLITADFVCNENQTVCNDNQIVINV